MMEPSNSRYKILLVLPDAALGGGHIMNLRLAEQLTRRGWTVDVVFLFGRHANTEYAIDFPELQLIHLHADGRLQRVLLPLHLARLARDYRLVLAGLDLAATNYGYIAARMANKPFIAWIHIAFDEHSQSISRFSKAISLWIYRRVPNIIFPSRGSMESLSRALGKKPKKAQWHIIENFNSHEKRDDTIPVKFNQIFSRPVVLSVGRLCPQKAYDRLVRIHAKLLQRNIGHNLVILGEGSERNRLEALAVELGVADSVYLPGHVPGPNSWFREAKVFALSSRYEGLPLVLIEALEAGLPVAAMDCPAGPREILDGGDVGILVPKDDEPALADAIARLLSDANLRNTFAERGMRKAKIYTPECVIPRWEALLNQII